MADDVKLQLGVDMEALQRSTSQAASTMAKQLEVLNIGPNVLGSGVAPNQGPTTQQGSKDTIRGVIDALERIERTLTIGFHSLSGGAYAGGGGSGPGAGVGSGAGGGGGAPPAGPAGGGAGGGRSYGFGSVLSGAGSLAQALMPSAMRMFMGGFYGTDVMGFVHNLVSQIPVAGKLLGAVTGPFHETMQKNDEFKNMQYELFRDVGEDAMKTFTNLWVDDFQRDQFVKRYGFSRAETQRLVNTGFRQGLGQGGGIETIMSMQGGLGLGEEAAATAGAMRKAGGGGNELDVFATAIGTAVSTGLERGRWGEMLTMWQRAAQSSVDTDIAWKEVAAQQQFIGSLGKRFQGDTPAAQSMDSALRQMASNTQSPLALRAAMELTGGDYFAATARMARAAEQPDTTLQERIIDQMMGSPGVQEWLAMPDGPDADRMLDSIAGVAVTYGTGLSQLKIASLLKARKGAQGKLFPGPSAEAVGVGRNVIQFGKLPDTALGPRKAASEAARPSDLTAIQGDQPLVEGGFQGMLRRAQEATGIRMRRMDEGDAASLPSMQEMRAGQFSISLTPPGSPAAAGQVPAGTSVSSAGPSPIGGLGELSAADIQSAAALAGIPVETMRSWFKIESAGRIEPDSGDVEHGQITARGFGRMSRGEAAMIGVGGADYERLSTDKAFSLQKSAELARRYLQRARQQAPAGWNEDDILHLMKLQHGGMGTAKFVMDDFQRRFGKPPKSWDEMFQAEKGVLHGGPGIGPLGALLNANKIEVHISVDQTGRVAGTTVRGAASSGPVTSPGQLVGGGR